MDKAIGELSPQQQKEWQMYLDALEKEEKALEAQRNTKRIQEWTPEEMEAWLRETQVAVISKEGGVLNKMKD